MSKDGGAAFPHELSDGISLRDWFAGMALQGLLAGQWHEGTPNNCKTAYRIADAMLAEKAGRDE